MLKEEEEEEEEHLEVGPTRDLKEVAEAPTLFSLLMAEDKEMAGTARRPATILWQKRNLLISTGSLPAPGSVLPIRLT